MGCANFPLLALEGGPGSPGKRQKEGQENKGTPLKRLSSQELYPLGEEGQEGQGTLLKAFFLFLALPEKVTNPYFFSSFPLLALQ